MLILKLSDRQQTLSESKLEIEKAIMAREGIDDGELWTKLIEIR